MPHLDVIDEMVQAKGLLHNLIDRSGKDRLHSAVDDMFEMMIEHVDDERKEWERVLNFLMEKEKDEDE